MAGPLVLRLIAGVLRKRFLLDQSDAANLHRLLGGAQGDGIFAFLKIEIEGILIVAVAVFQKGLHPLPGFRLLRPYVIVSGIPDNLLGVDPDSGKFQVLGIFKRNLPIDVQFSLNGAVLALYGVVLQTDAVESRLGHLHLIGDAALFQGAQPVLLRVEPFGSFQVIRPLYRHLCLRICRLGMGLQIFLITAGILYHIQKVCLQICCRFGVRRGLRLQILSAPCRQNQCRCQNRRQPPPGCPDGPFPNCPLLSRFPHLRSHLPLLGHFTSTGNPP